MSPLLGHPSGERFPHIADKFDTFPRSWAYLREEGLSKTRMRWAIAP